MISRLESGLKMNHHSQTKYHRAFEYQKVFNNLTEKDFMKQKGRKQEGWLCLPVNGGPESFSGRQ
jgi:phenylalanyl-tRNA synthetase beta subunit